MYSSSSSSYVKVSPTNARKELSIPVKIQNENVSGNV